MYSESDQTEDESEMFSSEGSVPGPKMHSLGKGSNRTSESTLKFVDVSVENGQTGCSSASLDDRSSASTARIPTEGDLRFARKVSLVLKNLAV